MKNCVDVNFMFVLQLKMLFKAMDIADARKIFISLFLLSVTINTKAVTGVHTFNLSDA